MVENTPVEQKNPEDQDAMPTKQYGKYVTEAMKTYEPKDEDIFLSIPSGDY